VEEGVMNVDRTKKRQIRLSHITFTLALEEMLAGPFTCVEISEHTGMTHRYVCRMVKIMHAKKVVHISGWGKDSKGRAGIRVFSLGPGRDAKRPTKDRTVVNRNYRNRVAGRVLAGTPFAGLMA
jgi:hypothetical protein